MCNFNRNFVLIFAAIILVCSCNKDKNDDEPIIGTEDISGVYKIELENNNPDFNEYGGSLAGGGPNNETITFTDLNSGSKGSTADFAFSDSESFTYNTSDNAHHVGIILISTNTGSVESDLDLTIKVYFDDKLRDEITFVESKEDLELAPFAKSLSVTPRNNFKILEGGN